MSYMASSAANHTHTHGLYFSLQPCNFSKLLRCRRFSHSTNHVRNKGWLGPLPASMSQSGSCAPCRSPPAQLQPCAPSPPIPGMLSRCSTGGEGQKAQEMVAMNLLRVLVLCGCCHREAPSAQEQTENLEGLLPIWWQQLAGSYPFLTSPHLPWPLLTGESQPPSSKRDSPDLNISPLVPRP